MESAFLGWMFVLYAGSFFLEDFAVIPLSPGPVTLRLGHSIKHK